ncbi:MAG: MATE family efflux transporter, partial [Deinococcota bacterium]
MREGKVSTPANPKRTSAASGAPLSRRDLAQEVRSMLRLALPIIIAQVAQNAMNFVDTVMAGRLGGVSLAGIALGGSVFMIIFLLALGILLSVSPMVSQAYGAGDDAMIGRATRQGMLLALVLYVPIWLILQNATLFLTRMGQDPDVVVLAAGYLKALSWGMLPILWLVVLRAMLEGLSRPLPVTIITLVGVGLNIPTNYTFMFGHFGVPRMGVIGTGWATSLVHLAMFVMTAWYVRRHFARYQIFAGIKRIDWAFMGELLKIGLPIGAALGAEAGMFSMSTILMGIVGTQEQAAHSIALQSTSVVFMVPLGLSTATAVRVGQAWGAGKPLNARRAGYVGMSLSILFMSMCAFCFWQFPEVIISLYLNLDDPVNSPLIPITARFLSIAAMFQIFDGLQVSAAGALRGLKDTRATMLIALLSYWLVGISSAVLLTFVLNFGGVGLWLGLVVGLVLASMLLVTRFRYKTHHMMATLPAE